MARRQLSFRRRTNNRALAFIVIIFILTLAIAPPVKHYFTQRAQINSLESQLSADNVATHEGTRAVSLRSSEILDIDRLM
jgi:hypothetical protein